MSPDPSASDPVAGRAATAPETTALVHPGGRWTYRELDRRVESAARRLASAGRRPGGPVVLVLETGSEAVVLLHAAARAGRPVAPLSPRLTAPELRDALAALEPDVVLCSDERAGELGALARGLEDADAAPRVVVVGKGDAEHGRPLASVPEHGGGLRALSPDQVRAVLWTSGTTGEPRGVLLTGANLAASARAAARHLGLEAGDRWYASLSVAHVGGLALVTRAAHLGSAVVARDGFDAGHFLRLARSGAFSHASLVPVMLRRVLDRMDGEAPLGLRCLLLGGAATPEPLLERALAAGLPVALTYGQTEASSQIATALPDTVRRKPGTVGRPLPGVELRVDDGGEIRVRGPTVAAGYLGREPFPVDEDGWLRTGDVGHLDADGDLWITGRLRARIISGGVNVDPAEVEAVLRAAVGVEDAVVVGVPHPEWGEAVAALVTSAPGAAPSVEAILEHCRSRLAGPKRPRRLRVVRELPRTATGKVARAAARRLLRAERAGGDP